MEKRLPPGPGALAKSTPLPVDYLRMLKEVLKTNFSEGLKAYDKVNKTKSVLIPSGGVFVDEIVLRIALSSDDGIAATTIHASCDFDPKASSPSAQELLAACVDGAGSLLSTLLDPKDEKQLQALGNKSLSALENVPFEWTRVEVERRYVYLKLDKTNPELENAADEWLAKHDPEFLARQAEEEAATEDLFFTGPKKTRH